MSVTLDRVSPARLRVTTSRQGRRSSGNSPIQVISFLREAEAGLPAKELCRKHDDRSHNARNDSTLTRHPPVPRTTTPHTALPHPRHHSPSDNRAALPKEDLPILCTTRHRKYGSLDSTQRRQSRNDRTAHEHRIGAHAVSLPTEAAWRALPSYGSFSMRFSTSLRTCAPAG